MDSDGTADDGSYISVNSEAERILDKDKAGTQTQETDEITLQVDNETIIPTDVALDYCYHSRNKDFDELCLWEHTQWVCKITKKIRN